MVVNMHWCLFFLSTWLTLLLGNLNRLFGDTLFGQRRLALRGLHFSVLLARPDFQLPNGSRLHVIIANHHFWRLPGQILFGLCLLKVLLQLLNVVNTSLRFQNTLIYRILLRWSLHRLFWSYDVSRTCFEGLLLLVNIHLGLDLFPQLWVDRAILLSRHAYLGICLMVI